MYDAFTQSYSQGWWCWPVCGACWTAWGSPSGCLGGPPRGPFAPCSCSAGCSTVAAWRAPWGCPQWSHHTFRHKITDEGVGCSLHKSHCVKCCVWWQSGCSYSLIVKIKINLTQESFKSETPVRLSRASSVHCDYFNSSYLALVSATLRRRGSFRKPIPWCSLARTQDRIMKSFSLPWKASTLAISTCCNESRHKVKLHCKNRGPKLSDRVLNFKQ